MSKTILTEVDGWTPVLDALVQQYGAVTALVFGKVWRYCQMDGNTCTASQGRMAEELGLSRRAFVIHARRLVEGGYLAEEARPGSPNVYRDTGKAGLAVTIRAQPVHEMHTPAPQVEGGVNEMHRGCESDSQGGVNEMHRGCESDSHKDSIKRDSEDRRKRGGERPPKTSAPPIEYPLDYPFGEMMPGQYDRVPELKLYHEVTRRIPGALQLTEIVRAVREGQLEKKSLTEAFRHWIIRDYNPGNLAWLIEWAPAVQRGEKPWEWKRAADPPAEPKGFAALRRVMAEVQNEEVPIGNP